MFWGWLHEAAVSASGFLLYFQNNAAPISSSFVKSQQIARAQTNSSNLTNSHLDTHSSSLANVYLEAQHAFEAIRLATQDPPAEHACSLFAQC